MFRRLALAVALAAATAGAGCGKSAPAKHQVVPGAKAGVVLEATGTVTATRPGAAARPLAKGDAVSGDDVIETGADGSVLIELDHNHVTFTLPAGKQQQVATSLAWTQPVAAARPGTTDENSAAAGRAIERSAVDTAASSSDEAPGTVAAPEKDVPQLQQPVAPEQPKSQPKPPETATERGPKIEADKGTKSKDDPRLDTRSGGGAGEAGGGGGGAGDEEDRGGKETAPLKATEPTVGAAQLAPAMFALSIQTTGELTRDEVRGVLDMNKIAACFQKLPAKVTIVVTTTGAAGRVTTDGDKAATTCVRGVLKPLTFRAGKAETTIAIDLSPTG